MSASANNICISIADIVVKFHCKECRLFLGEIHQNFITKSQKADYYIEVLTQIPLAFKKLKPVFRSSKSSKLNEFPEWSISYLQGHLIIYAPLIIQQLLTDFYLEIVPGSNHWRIYHPISLDKEINPLPYPLANLLYYYLLLFNGGLNMHASAVHKNGKVALFTGSSGSGKSTIANILSKNSFGMIHDDMIFIKNEKLQYAVHSSPIYPYDTPKKGILSNLFILKHSKTNKIRKLDFNESLRTFLPHIIQHHYDKKIIENQLDTLEDIIKYHPCYELKFKPDNEVSAIVNDLI